MKTAFTMLMLCLMTFAALGCSKKDDHSQHMNVQPAVQNAPQNQTEQTAASVQTTCPIMGGAIDSALYVDQDGKRIYVCCSSCLESVKKDFAAAEKALIKIGQKPESVQ